MLASGPKLQQPPTSGPSNFQTFTFFVLKFRKYYENSYHSKNSMLKSGAVHLIYFYVNGVKLYLLIYLLLLLLPPSPQWTWTFEDTILILCCPPYLLWKNNNKTKQTSTFSILLVLLYIFSSTGTEVISTTMRS